MQYPIILADPPWTYDNKKTGGSMTSGADAQYSTLSIQDIAALPVLDVAEKDAVLFLWATVPLLPEALHVMQSWGFTYKTKVVWDKQRYGLGFWFRGQHEDLLIGVRGKPRPFRSSARNIVAERSQGHSRKPQAVYDLIDAVRGSQPVLELFARPPVPAWITATGLELDGKDIRQALQDITHTDELPE